MSLLKKKAIPSLDLPPVRYEVGGQEISLADANRMVRRLLLKEGEKFQRKFAALVHPETGDRPAIVLTIPDPSKPSLQCRLVTDSEETRAWLKSQGIVIGEVVAGEAAKAQ